jgi:hypothetical protein
MRYGVALSRNCLALLGMLSPIRSNREQISNCVTERTRVSIYPGSFFRANERRNYPFEKRIGCPML